MSLRVGTSESLARSRASRPSRRIARRPGPSKSGLSEPESSRFNGRHFATFACFAAQPGSSLATLRRIIMMLRELDSSRDHSMHWHTNCQCGAISDPITNKSEIQSSALGKDPAPSRVRGSTPPATSRSASAVAPKHLLKMPTSRADGTLA